MAGAWASVGGSIVPADEATFPATDPAVTSGWTVFETASVQAGTLPLLDRHLDRLEASATAACIALPPRDRLVADAVALAAHHGGLGRLRITVSGSGRWVLTVHDVDPSRRGAPVRAVRGPHHDEPFLGGAVKHGSRAPWVVAVLRSGVDEVLLHDADGRFTEATTAGIVAVVDGVLLTAPQDSRILPSTTVAEVVERATALGIAVRHEAPSAWGPWDALYVASATRWLAPVVLLDGMPLPGWDPVGRRLSDG